MNELIGKIVVIKRNGADGPQFPLRTTECFFGRKPACDIRIQLPNVSLEHAVVKVDGKDKIRIINLSSTNQTLVNGKPITEAEVKHLDVFTISDRSFRFEFASPVLKRGKDKSPKTKIRRSVSLVKTPPEGQSPKMPVALKGSPRTPTAGKSLKENIHRLRRFSMPLQEEDENLSSPVSNKPPLSTIFVNAEPQDKSNHQESTEQVNVVKPVEVVKEETRRNSKRVSFGPVLSPEHFDKDLPPATPVRRGSTPKRAASSTKRRRSVLLVPKTDCIKEDDGDVEDFFMTEDVDSNAKSLKEHHISPEEDSHESESVRKESTAVQEKVPGSIRDTPERGQPSSELITPKSTKPKSRRRSSSLVGEMKLELTETSRVTTASDTVTEESKNARRSSLRLAQKSPVQRSIAPETAATASNDDEDIDETILDSDDYTSDEEDPVGGEGKETGQSKLGKALKEEEVKQQKAKKMATPMKNEIANGVNLRQTKKKMTTPLRKEIEEGVKLHETKKRMATPLKKDIENGTNLRQTKKKMATPLKKEIKEGITLQQTKKMMATPLKKEIETGTSLRETKKKLATPLKKEIENGTNLRETKKRLATPLKKEIENGTNLRQTKKMMGTPLKKEIETGTSLRETKKKLATPLKKEIENGTSLRQTKKMMGTPLKKEIKEGIKLHQTKKTMATPLKKEIKNGTSLRQTKKKMATPLRTEILEGVKLRETKKKLQTPVRKAIEDGVTLKKTKSKLSTPLRKAIQAKPELRQTKKIMNVLLQDDIKQGVNLRKTKQSMPLEVQIEIIKGKKLRSTKKSLPTPVKNDISGGVTLRKTKKSLPTPLKEQIKKGLPLQKTKKSLPTPVRKQLEGKVTLKSTVKSVKRKRSEGGLNEHDAKRMKTSPSEEVNEESKGFQEAPVRRALKTPLRKAIIAGRKLRPTRHRMATPLRTGIHSRPALRAVRRKSSSVRDEIGRRKPTYAEIVKRATKNAVRRSSKGNSFKFGKTAPICKKAESVPPANVADVVAADHEVPSKPVNDSQAIQKRRSARLDGKAVPQAMIDSVGVLNSPETDENAPHSTWMSSLARATNGVKARAKPVEDFEGLVEMFATPPMVGISKKDTSKQQKGSNWLSSLAKATKPPRKRGIAVEDFEGVPEMFATPPSISVATPRTTAEDELTSSPEEQDLHLTESLKLSKTPSLRSFGEDTEFVQIVTPIHSSHTPSLRSRNAQTIKSSVTPELLLEMKEALMTQKTPSLRSSAKDAVTVEVVTPLQPSRTPSLRSAMQQTSVFSSESPDIKMEVIKPIAPTKTPSIRSSAQVKAVSAVHVKKPSTSDRKSLGLQGLARLMKVPKENNAVENVEDFFAPSVFASPKPEPKRYSRKSEGLQGVARLLRTPGDMGEGAAVESPKFDGIKKMMRTEKAVASPNFVGLRALMQTPKDSKRAVDLEEHFISDLFLLPVEDSFQDTVQSVVQGECDKEQDVQAINLISPESEEKTAEASEDVSSETIQRVTRAKRKPPEKLPEPVPKRGRTTRAAAKQSSESKKSPSNLKVVQRKTTTRSKKSSAASLPSTPKPLEFKRTQLDPIIEVLSPLPAIDQTVEVAASTTLVEPEATEKAFTRGGAEETTDFKAQQTEPSRCSRRGIRAKARVDSSSGECSGGEVAEKRVATKRRTRAKVEEDSGSSSVDVQKADVETGKSGGKGRATRSSQLKEAPSQNVKLPRTTRSGRNRRAEVAEVEDKVVIGDAADETINNSTTTRSRRKARTTEESASVMSEEESVRNGKVQQNDAEATKVRRTRSRRTADKNNTVNEDKLAQSSQAKRTKKESVAKADEETQSEEKEASSKQRSTRRTRGNPVESIVPESTAASLQEVENFQSKSSVKNVRGKREPKGKALEEPRTTRSSRSANPAKIKPTVEPQLPVRSTRGRKRQLGEEEVAEPAVPEAKRKRSSARARDVEPPQTRSLRSRK